jgi:hypothetical protein
MALQTSGAISFSQIASEFEDTAPNSASEFYRGGLLVPDATANANIPTSGALSFNNFYGSVRRFLSGHTSTYDADGYRYYIFETSTTMSCAGITNAEWLILGGGGAGGSTAWGGGGGAGGYVTGSGDLDGDYPIVIGAGGATKGVNGDSSSFNSQTAAGGGYGGWDINLSAVQPPPDGYASGGGGAGSKYSDVPDSYGGVGTASNGGNGYAGGSGADGGGGGGGAGGNGGNASNSTGGLGGVGIQWLDGNYYAGGGGGYGNGGGQRAGGAGYDNYGGGGQANTISAQKGAVILRFPI